MSTPLKVLIAHVPYEVRGGEDVHVDLLAEAYRAIGYDPIFFPADRKFNSSLLKSALDSLKPGHRFEELDRLWKESKPSFIHLHNAFPLLGPRFFRWLIANKIPTLMTVHNHRFFCTNGLALRDGQICKDCFSSRVMWRPVLYNCNGSRKKSIYHAMALTEMRTENLYDRAITKFIAPSPYLRNELIKLGIDSKKITHILNPIGKASVQTQVVKPERQIFYAGRLSHEKGIQVLIETARLLPEMKFIIAGDGPERARVDEAVASLGNIKYIGQVGLERVMQTLAESQVAVLPSICNEILPTLVLEAYALGRRCVVPDSESTRWLAQGGFPGHLAKMGSPRDFAVAIQAALSAPGISEAQRSDLARMFSLKRFSDDLSKLVSALRC